MSEGREKTFAVARGSKIADTVGIETIEYRRMKVARGSMKARVRSIRTLR